MTFARLLGMSAVAGCLLLILTTMAPAPLVSVSRVSAFAADPESPASAVAPVATPRPAPAAAATSGPTYDRQGLAVVRPPSIDADTIRRVLKQANSPAVDEAEAFFDLGEQYGLDPAVCLAFFIVESNAGTKGMAAETRSIGNIRATAGYVNYKGYRRYDTWREGAEDWYRLISRLYVGEWSLMTVETIVPVYAPSGDGNDPSAYINTVRRLVTDWRSGRV